MRLLIRLQHHALPRLADQRAPGGDVPEPALEVVRSVIRPQREDLVDGLDEHRVAVGVEVAARLHVGAQAARADAEYEAPLQHVVHHGDVRRDLRGVVVGQVDRAAPQLDVLRLVRDAGNEAQARRDGLAHVGDVLADERLAVSEAVRQQHRLAILLQRLRVVAPGRVHGHGEESKFHSAADERRLDPEISRQDAKAAKKHKFNGTAAKRRYAPMKRVTQLSGTPPFLPTETLRA